jgi:hypothetical protein
MSKIEALDFLGAFGDEMPEAARGELKASMCERGLITISSKEYDRLLIENKTMKQRIADLEKDRLEEKRQ